MALKETIQITVDEAGLKQLQAALKKAGGEVNNFNNFLKEERTEGRKANFVINESTKSARALSAAFGGAGSGLIGNMSKAVNVFDDLGFAMSAAQVGADKMGGKMSTLAAGIGRIAIPIAIATAAWTLYSDTIDGFTKRSEAATKELRDIQLQLGEISFEEYNAQLKAELDKLVAEGKTIGDGFWQNFFNSPVVQMAGGATAQTIADMINKSVKADKDENNRAQGKLRAQGGLSLITNRDALQEIEFRLQQQQAIARNVMLEQEKRIAAEERITALTKERENILQASRDRERARLIERQNIILDIDNKIKRLTNTVGKSTYPDLADVIALYELQKAKENALTSKVLGGTTAPTSTAAPTTTTNVPNPARAEWERKRSETEKWYRTRQYEYETLSALNPLPKTEILSTLPDSLKAGFPSTVFGTAELVGKEAERLKKELESINNELSKIPETIQQTVAVKNEVDVQRATRLSIAESEQERLKLQSQLIDQGATVEQAKKVMEELVRLYTISKFNGGESGLDREYRTRPQYDSSPLRGSNAPTQLGFKPEISPILSSGQLTPWEALMGNPGDPEAGVEKQLDVFESSFVDAFSVIGEAGVQMWEDMFGGANSLLEQFIARFMGSLTDQVFNAGIGALLSLLPGGGLLNFFTGKYHDGGIVKAHSGMYLNAPASQDIPIIARGGEMVLTEQQQGRLFSMANGQGGSSAAPVNVSLTINAMDAQSVRNTFSKKEIQRELMKAIGEATRSGRMAW